MRKLTQGEWEPEQLVVLLEWVLKDYISESTVLFHFSAFDHRRAYTHDCLLHFFGLVNSFKDQMQVLLAIKVHSIITDPKIAVQLLICCFNSSTCDIWVFQQTANRVGHIMSGYLSLAVVLPYVRVRNDVLQIKLFNFVHNPLNKGFSEFWIHEVELLFRLI